MMKYLKDAQGGIHGFDTSDQRQVDLMNSIGAGWTDVTTSWPPAPVETAADIDAAVQAELDQMAQRKGYQDAATCVSYMNSGNATWKADATAMNKYRDDAWAYAISQEAITPLPSVASVKSGIAALASNPGW